MLRVQRHRELCTPTAVVGARILRVGAVRRRGLPRLRCVKRVAPWATACKLFHNPFQLVQVAARGAKLSSQVLMRSLQHSQRKFHMAKRTW